MPDIVQLCVRDDVVINPDVWLPVNLLQQCRAQPQPDLASPGLQVTPEDVREARPEFLTATQSCEVPAIVTGLQQPQLGVVGGHPGPDHPGLDQLGSLLLWWLLIYWPGEQVTILLPCHHSLVVLLGCVVQELEEDQHQH